MRRAIGAAVLVILLSAAPVHSFDLEDVLRSLFDQALTVSIIARITENGRETIQTYELTRVTISGRAVRLRLEGGNLTVIVEFTPYEDSNGILLVAEGTILLRTPDNEEVKYVTSMRSVPIAAGERVFFYPLGRSAFDMSLESEESGTLNIELELEVSPYRAREG